MGSTRGWGGGPRPPPSSGEYAADLPLGSGMARALPPPAPPAAAATSAGGVWPISLAKACMDSSRYVSPRLVSSRWLGLDGRNGKRDSMMYNITLARVLYVGLDCIQFRSFKVREVLAIVRVYSFSRREMVVFGVMSARNGAAAKKMPPTVVSRVSAGLLRERPWRDGGDAEPTTDPEMLHTRIQRPAEGTLLLYAYYESS